MATKIYIFRHTETHDNYSHTFSGRRDVDLTPNGREQAEKLALALREKNIEIAFSSPLKRARQTMEIVGKYHPKLVTCLDIRIIERSYGLLEGQSKDKWAERGYATFKDYHRSLDIPPPGGESILMVRRRVKPFLIELVRFLGKKPRNTAICAHSNSIRPLREYFEKLKIDQINQIESEVGQLFEYEL